MKRNGELVSDEAIWSQAAIDALRNIHDFIAQDSPQGAKKVTQELVKLGQSLEIFPSRYPLEPLLAEETLQYRFTVKWNYKLIYTVEETQVLIVLIFDTRQLPEKLKL
ncbi:MAG: type II toxin-antitoxin system RelE/ParE family toxin [Saprospiraceae bacterium]